MKGITLILINITLMHLIHCFSMFFAQLNITKIASKLNILSRWHVVLWDKIERALGATYWDPHACSQVEFNSS